MLRLRFSIFSLFPLFLPLGGHVRHFIIKHGFQLKSITVPPQPPPGSGGPVNKYFLNYEFMTILNCLVDFENVLKQWPCPCEGLILY